MLTTKELKTLVGFAEGFWGTTDYDSNFSLGLGLCIFDMRTIGESYNYDLFLTRCIEGINRDKNHDWIIQDIYYIEAETFDRVQTFLHDGTTTEIRTAKEECLRWVLNNDIQ